VPYSHQAQDFNEDGFIFLDPGLHLPLDIVVRCSQLHNGTYSFNGSLTLDRKHLKLVSSLNGLSFLDSGLNQKSPKKSTYCFLEMDENQLKDCSLGGVTTEEKTKLHCYSSYGEKILGLKFKNLKKLELQIEAGGKKPSGLL
jgi:hypothetical protein